MDVEELAPALLALASLIQTANHKFNGDRSAVRVTVNADIDQKCFQIKIKFIQDLLELAKSFLDGDIATLKEICEWLGIVGGGSFSLFKLLIALGKRQQDTTKFTASADGDQTVYQIAHVENLHVHLPPETPQEVRDLIADPVIVSKALEVIKPAAQEGYNEVSFYRPRKAEPEFRATKEDVQGALAIPPQALALAPPEGDGDETPVPFKTRVFVKAQRNEGVGQWELKWGGRAKLVTIDDTEWLERFQKGDVPHNLPLYLDVQMEMITSNTDPNAPDRFRVVKVLGVVPPDSTTQGNMFDDDSPKGA